MSPDLVAKDELIASGWKDRQIDAALDEPDEVGPSGHWMNTYGKPYYFRDRAELASYRIGLSSLRPPEAIWQKWLQSEKPTSLPELTIDFHRLADLVISGASRQFWSLRLSHPVLGRQDGTRLLEQKLIEEALIALVNHASGIKLKDASAVYHYLTEIAEANTRTLGPQFPSGVTVRKALRASYVSKATGKKTVLRCLEVFALIHTGQILGWDDRKLDLIKLLIYAPNLRIDPKQQLVSGETA